MTERSLRWFVIGLAVVSVVALLVAVGVSPGAKALVLWLGAMAGILFVAMGVLVLWVVVAVALWARGLQRTR
jgi:hypothetical protein